MPNQSKNEEEMKHRIEHAMRRGETLEAYSCDVCRHGDCGFRERICDNCKEAKLKPIYCKVCHMAIHIQDKECQNCLYLKRQKAKQNCCVLL